MPRRKRLRPSTTEEPSLSWKENALASRERVLGAVRGGAAVERVRQLCKEFWRTCIHERVQKERSMLKQQGQGRANGYREFLRHAKQFYATSLGMLDDISGHSAQKQHAKLHFKMALGDLVRYESAILPEKSPELSVVLREATTWYQSASDEFPQLGWPYSQLSIVASLQGKIFASAVYALSSGLADQPNEGCWKNWKLLCSRQIPILSMEGTPESIWQVWLLKALDFLLHPTQMQDQDPPKPPGTTLVYTPDDLDHRVYELDLVLSLGLRVLQISEIKAQRWEESTNLAIRYFEVVNRVMLHCVAMCKAHIRPSNSTSAEHGLAVVSLLATEFLSHIQRHPPSDNDATLAEVSQILVDITSAFQLSPRAEKVRDLLWPSFDAQCDAELQIDAQARERGFSLQKRPSIPIEDFACRAMSSRNLLGYSLSDIVQDCTAVLSIHRVKTLRRHLGEPESNAQPVPPSVANLYPTEEARTGDLPEYVTDASYPAFHYLPGSVLPLIVLPPP
mmetsp:Transcript_6256/g.12395  ORF Transcript_6256/g.12395 Transcript_6256/m.12395 type:complete len:507 (-) Transcript_6256:952-2472(-)